MSYGNHSSRSDSGDYGRALVFHYLYIDKIYRKIKGTSEGSFKKKELLTAFRTAARLQLQHIYDRILDALLCGTGLPLLPDTGNVSLVLLPGDSDSLQ